MKITSTTLRAIADKMEELEKIDVEITSFRMHGLSITVKSASDQMDGRTIYVTRIVESTGLRNRNITTPTRKPSRDQFADEDEE